MSGTENNQITLSSANLENRSLQEINPFFGSEDTRMKERQQQLGLPVTQLNVDIDNTFYRADRDEASKKLAVICYESSIPIHAITGGSFKTVFDRIQKGELPYFQIISGAVGTERYILHINADGSKKYVRDTDYDKKMANTNYNRLDVARSAQSMITELSMTDAQSLWNLNFQQPESEALYLHEPTQAPEGLNYKVSFYFFSSNGIDELQKIVESRYPDKKIVICEEIGYNSKLSTGDRRKKYCLDILPITKADALADVATATGTQMNIIAGDSGNDIRMLQDTGDVSIAVGGAKQELLDSVSQAVGETTTGSFDKVVQPDNKTKWYYRERKKPLAKTGQTEAEQLTSIKERLKTLSVERRGPESVIYALRVLVRSAMIYQDKITEHYQLQLNEQQNGVRSELKNIYNRIMTPGIESQTLQHIYHMPALSPA